MKKEKGKTKSEKVWTSILFTFSLLLFTSAANAAELPTGYADFATFFGMDQADWYIYEEGQNVAWNGLNGTYSFTANGKSYTATVADGSTTAVAQ